MYRVMCLLCCHTYPTIISSLKIYFHQITSNRSVSINKLTVIYLWWHKLACRIKMSAGESKNQIFDGKMCCCTNSIYFIALFITGKSFINH